MHKRQLTVIGIVLIAVTILLAVSSFNQEAQTKKTQTQEEEATVVQKGQVTEKERAYSKKYDELYPNRIKNKISELRKEIKNLGIVIGTVGDIVELSNAPIITPQEFLNTLSCESDTIVTGYIKSKAAHLSEDETLVYTQYEFTIEDVLKNNSTSSIESNQNIEITRPGGVIKFDNRIITVKDERYEPLQMEKKYLLFLQSIPEANGYTVASPNGDFILENKSFKKISKGLSPDGLVKGESMDLLNNVQQSISTGCQQSPKGGN